jgi:hypothetical protein
VSFGAGSHLDYTPQTNFKNPINGVIGQLAADNSGTNSSDGLWNAYQAIENLNDMAGLNVIVFFTDGVSTHFSGNFDVTTGPCLTQKLNGVVGTYSTPGSTRALGLTVVDPGGPPVVGDESNYIFAHCGFRSAVDPVVFIPVIPTVDLHGTSVFGLKPIPIVVLGLPVMHGLNIKPLTENLTINTAARARQSSLKTRIYSIGLGGETNSYPADHELMRSVANDPEAASYNNLQPTGLYVYAPDPTQLHKAFQRVASEITRLIQ